MGDDGGEAPARPAGRKKAAWILGSLALIGAGGAAAYMLIGHEAEEVAACRTFTQSALRSPSTYREVKVTSFDRTITEPELRAQHFPDASDEIGQLILAGVRGRRLGLRTVMLEYDASNAYGTPIRGLGGCEFLLVDGELRDKGSLESRARSAALERDTATLAEATNSPELRRLTRRRGPGLPCCVR